MIAVSLAKEDWIVLGDFLSQKVGQMVNPIPAIQLLQELSATDPEIMAKLKKLNDERKKGR